MNCHEESSLHGYLDGEVDAVRALEIEAHLRECQACSAEYERYRGLRQSLQGSGLYFKAPPRLEQSVRARLRVPHRRFANWRLAAAAACIVALAAFSALLFELERRPSENELLAQQVAASHIRSLMANHLTDVLSSDRHTVKPWFTGKLDFAPVVKDFAGDGFPLVGGRLDYVADRPVAALLYKRDRHVINLFIWPSERASSGIETALIKGYNVMSWTDGHMNYWAVSDLNAGELERFVQDERR